MSREQQSFRLRYQRQSIKDTLSFVELENLDILIISEEDEPKRLPRSLNSQQLVKNSSF